MLPSSLPRKLPSQRRSQDTHAAILEGARRILRTDGAATFTMAHLANVAGVSVGSLYQYFRDRAGVLQALRDEHFVELQHILQFELPVALGEPTLGATARRLFASMHRLLARDAAVLAVVLRADPAGFSSSCASFDALREQLEVTIKLILEPHRATLATKDLEMAAMLVARHVTGSTYGVLMITPQYLQDERLLEESVAMLVRYLGVA
jgi:AcrR family transcriptional regulator